MTGKIICGYSGVGKSYAAKVLTTKKYKVIDLESSRYTKDSTWPRAYVDDIIQRAEKDNTVVLCSCHEEVRDELCKRNKEFVIVAPADDILYEYTKRWYCRGSSIKFIRDMQIRWTSMHQSIHRHGNNPNVIVILLDKYEYIKDLIERLIEEDNYGE